MRKIIFILVFVLALQAAAQEVEVISYENLAKKIQQKEAPLSVFNFWTTWCAPCVKELPYFDKLNAENDDLKVYLVSLDFQNQLHKVKKLVGKLNLESPVMFLNEKDPSTYLTKISKDWSGAVPATLFVNQKGKTYFHESAFTREELVEMVNKYLN